MDKQELIATLKSQHRQLQADLSVVLEETRKESDLTCENIFASLAKFKNDLAEHQELENGVFYVDYLSKKSERGEDTTSTQEFIRQMTEIGNTVDAFLAKYATCDAIRGTVSGFTSELATIIRILNMRIETEEDGVFGLYLVM